MMRIISQGLISQSLIALGLTSLVCFIGCEPVASESQTFGPDLSVELTAANFDTQVLQNEQLVLVDFWAPWCGPCREMEPAIAEISRKFEERLLVGKVNVDEQQDLAVSYRIEGIPALLLFQRGEVVEYLVGGRSAAELTSVLLPYLQHGPAPK